MNGENLDRADGAADLPPAEESQHESKLTPIVLIIDDDADHCAALADLLDAEGIVAKTFTSAADFLAAYDPNIPGCILLDVRMKAMSGLDLLERLRGDGLMMPVIMMSAHDDTASTVRAIRGGAMTFLKKPFLDQLLLDNVNQAIAVDLDRRREERAVNTVQGRYGKLTPAETEVFDWILRGFTSREIADELERDVTHKTIEAHRSNVMKKMEARNVAHLVYLAHILKLPVLRQIFDEEFP